jgi:CubicO group peptidase (beta-lactamase class C family)
MKKYFITLLLLLYLCLPFNASAQPGFVQDSLEVYMENALKSWNIPGIAMAIVKDDQVLVCKGYGVWKAGSPEKVDENTLFMIGSNTKAFTGMSLAKLDFEGRCSLDDPVKKWFQAFTLNDPWMASHANLTDILTHRIGMATFQGDFLYWTSGLTQEEVIERFGKIEPEFEFRTRYGYTNAGFLVAGKCIEAISGKTWGDYVKENFLLPLGMHHTRMYSEEIIHETNKAWPHIIVHGDIREIPFPSIDNLAPAGSMSSSVADMSLWLLALLNNGELNGNPVIPGEVIQKAWKPQAIIGRSYQPDHSGHYRLYSLGWVLEDYAGREIISHTGGVNGFLTSVTLVPEEDLGIVILTNSLSNDFYEAAKWDIIDAFLGLPSTNNNRKALREYQTMQKNREAEISIWKKLADEKKETDLPLDSYAGTYTNSLYGKAELVKSGASLQLKLEHHPDLTGELRSLGGNRFLCTYNDPVFGSEMFTFKVESGQVKSFILTVDDFVDTTPYVFRKI